MKTPFKSLGLLFAAGAALWLVAPCAVADDARFFRVVGPTAATITSLTPDGYITWTNAQIGSNYTVQTARALGDATNWVDYIQVPASNNIVTERLYDPAAPAGMVLIPAGSFKLGDAIDGMDWPMGPVYISPFYMDANLVTYALWTNVYQWATNHGYSFDNPGLGQAANHPVQTVNWYDAVKWCNARSEMEGRTPAYYTDGTQTAVYRSGTNDLANAWVNWNAGYRLPTEAEWEKAARGGAVGHRFPWTDTDNIDWSRANYTSEGTNGQPMFPYDVNPLSGSNPMFTSGGQPYTSPVGVFAANGYGLYDMAGNVEVWCWNWLDGDWFSNPLTTLNDPRGPSSNPYGYRVRRGGMWVSLSAGLRCANRMYGYNYSAGAATGFRCARGL